MKIVCANQGLAEEKRDRNKMLTTEAGMLSPDKNVIEGDEDEPVIEAHLRKIVFSENLQCIIIVFLYKQAYFSKQTWKANLDSVKEGVPAHAVGINHVIFSEHNANTVYLFCLSF